VTLQWERRAAPEQGWEVAYLRWFFSPHFQPVERWGLNGEAAVAAHLSSCPYNIRTEHRRQERTSQEARDLLLALGAKVKLKKDSEWFIQ
jgi:hypothetical protein